MKAIFNDKLIIENHQHWLNKDCEGWENMRADLRFKDLRRANFSHADLHWANFGGANLEDANFYGANLSEVNFSEANLHNANLSETNLKDVNLGGAILEEANLNNANLYGADLQDASLRWAVLRGADLYNASLHEAALYGADLHGAKNVPFIPLACPDAGAFIGWKKVQNYIIKLQIPEDAKRSSATTTKCRCDKALVLAIENIDGTPASKTSIVNMNYAVCRYTVGKMVYPDSFDEDRWNECSHGIHFFVNRPEAEKW